MTGLERLLHFINMFAAAIVAGGQLVVLLVIVPTKRNFETRVSVLVHNAMLGHQIDYFMKPSGIVSFLSALTIVVLHGAGVFTLNVTSLVFTILGMAGTLGVIVTSRFFNVRTNLMMAKWSLDAIPEDYPAIRKRWDLVHTIRASCGVLALSCYLVAALTRP